jgi:hypothetical protein
MGGRIPDEGWDVEGKRTSNNKCKDEMQGFFAPLRMTTLFTSTAFGESALKMVLRSQFCSD